LALGPFTFRMPSINPGFTGREALQGLSSLATAWRCAADGMEFLGLAFEEAWRLR